MNKKEILINLFEKDLQEEIEMKFKSENKQFSYKIKAKKYKTKEEYMINYNFLLNPENELKMYEISWKIEDKDLEKIKERFSNILDKIEKRKEELNIK